MTEERGTMRDVDHTHPHDDRGAGDLFLRGPVVAADGGERNAAGGDRSDDDVPAREREPETETMRDVDHTSPHGEEEANRVFERGERPAVETETVEE